MTWLAPALRALVVATALSGLAACANQPPPLPPETATTTPATPSVMLTVNFLVGSWAILPESKPTLDNLATAMNSGTLAQARFTVAGHTDVTGRLARNMTLSELRAAAVKDYLVAHGVAATRLDTHGYGPLKLLPGLSPRDPKNRRVEIVRNP